MDIVLVHIPTETGKKEYDAKLSFEKSLNFGILSIASHLAKLGFSARVIDTRISNYETWIGKVVSEIEKYKPRIVGLSCISAFSYETFSKTVNDIKNYFPSTPIVAGGKDFLGVIPEQIIAENPHLDAVIQGEAEQVCEEIIVSIDRGNNWASIGGLISRDSPATAVATSMPKSQLDHPPTCDCSLYSTIKSFAPSLEVSRGCSYGCSFCMNHKEKIRKKPVPEIIQELTALEQYYGVQNLCVYFETPMFCMTKMELRQLASGMKCNDIRATWRTETRVEYLKDDTLELLWRAGLRVMDLGLESGSPRMLRDMKKTSRPQFYLDNASRALKKAANLGMIIKVNVLFFAGETVESIKETIGFLESHSDCVKAVSAYPLVLFPGLPDEKHLTNLLSRCGGSHIGEGAWSQGKYIEVDLSSTVSHDRASHIGKLIGRSFQSIETYYRQKKYGYFSPGVSYTRFFKEASEVGLNRYPFYISSGERERAKSDLRHTLEEMNALVEKD